MNVPVSAEQALECAKSMVHNPFAKRYLLRSEASGDNRIYTADDVLGERLARLAGLMLAESEAPGSLILPPQEITERLPTLIHLAAIALAGTPYLWTEEVRAAVRSGEIPRHVLSPRLLPQPTTWHTFETGIQLGGTLTYNGRRYIDGTVDAFIVRDVGRGFEVLMLGEMVDSDTGHPVPAVTGGTFKYGTVYPDDYDNELLKQLESIVRLFAFLASPYIPKRQERPSRSARRESQRAGYPAADDDLVTFVVLRRPITRSHRTDEEQAVDWQHRWIVSGHLRAQWYPSEQAHRLIWIAPYMKGPDDKPLLEHAYKVAR